MNARQAFKSELDKQLKWIRESETNQLSTDPFKGQTQQKLYAWRDDPKTLTGQRVSILCKGDHVLKTFPASEQNFVMPEKVTIIAKTRRGNFNVVVFES